MKKVKDFLHEELWVRSDGPKNPLRAFAEWIGATDDLHVRLDELKRVKKVNKLLTAQNGEQLIISTGGNNPLVEYKGQQVSEHFIAFLAIYTAIRKKYKTGARHNSDTWRGYMSNSEVREVAFNTKEHNLYNVYLKIASDIIN